MRPGTVIAALGMVALFPAAAVAADVAADVQTWTGQVWRLGQATWEIAYTAVPPPGGTPSGAPSPEGAPLPPGAPLPDAAGTGASVSLFGSMRSAGGPGNRAPQALQGRRPTEDIVLRRDGIELRVPTERIATLTFARQLVVPNGLPPYLAVRQFRHAVSAILTDGSRVDADYVNLGATVLTGMTAHGTAEIPWNEIAVVRFATTTGGTPR